MREAAYAEPEILPGDGAGPLGPLSPVTLEVAPSPDDPPDAAQQLAPAYNEDPPAVDVAGAIDEGDLQLNVAPGNVPCLPPNLTLNQAIREVLERDPQLRAGIQAIRQANADLVTAGLPPNPYLAVNQTLLPLGRPFTVTRQGGPPQLDAFLSYPIDWYLFGKQAAAVKSAQWNVDISSAEFADLVRQRVDGAIQAFLDVLEAQRVVELANANVEGRRRMEGIFRKSAEAADVAVLDADRVRLSVLDASQTLANEQAKLEQARSRLSALLGHRVGRVAGSLDVGELAQPLAVEESLALAERNRPDVIALHKQIHKAEADIAKEHTNAKPSVTPLVGYTLQFQRKAIGFPNANSYDFGVGMSLPIFDRNQGNIEKAHSALLQRRREYELKLREIRGEIEQVSEEFRTARELLQTALPEQLHLAEHLRDKTKLAFEAGEKVLLDVLDAERNYQDACAAVRARPVALLARAAPAQRGDRQTDAALGRSVCSEVSTAEKISRYGAVPSPPEKPRQNG